MIAIVIERCTGCGACVEVCPTGALYLVEGKATIDRALCRECKACLAACPDGAILSAAQGEATAETAHPSVLLPEAPRQPEPAVIQVNTVPSMAPLRSQIGTLLGSLLAWTGREVLAGLLDLIPQRSEGRTCRRKTPVSGAKGGGHRHRHRQRGG